MKNICYSCCNIYQFINLKARATQMNWQFCFRGNWWWQFLVLAFHVAFQYQIYIFIKTWRHRILATLHLIIDLSCECKTTNPWQTQMQMSPHSSDWSHPAPGHPRTITLQWSWHQLTLTSLLSPRWEHHEQEEQKRQENSEERWWIKTEEWWQTIRGWWEM